MADFMSTQVDGNTMRLWLAEPQGFAGPRPGVVVLHHKGGLDAFTRDRVQRLADAGYIAAAPDLYHRTPEADEDGKMKALRDSQILVDVAESIAALKMKTPLRTDAVAVLGHCMGGRMAFLAAAGHPVFAAAVAYYSGNMFKAWGEGVPTPYERLKNLPCPVLGFFGNDDKNPSPEDVTKIDAELTRLGIRHVFHRYDGAGHAFQNFTNSASYRPDQAEDAWNKTLIFLAAELRP